MREVLQLKLRCVQCGTGTVIAVLPWPVKGSRSAGILQCPKCPAAYSPSYRYDVEVIKALTTVDF